MPAFKDITGQKFNYLTAISYESIRKPSGRSVIYWICQCDCGNITKVNTQSLQSGCTKSCGCWNVKQIIKRSKTHGKRHTRLYNSWAAMKQRCTNQNAINYPNYGGRGITICEEWLNSFEQFANDMGDPPTNKHSIERIDNNLGYCKENCKWATREERNSNKRNCHLLSFNGKTMNIMSWAKETGLPKTTIRRRLSLGWSIEKTLTTPKIN